MKTVETKISKSGATIYYVDGKRTSRENAMFIQRMNDVEARRLAKIEAEKAERENELATVNNEVNDSDEVKADETQAGTISISADAVGNGRVVVKVYGNHECATAKLDDIAAKMPRLRDINIIAHDHRNFIAKGASYNGRYYANSNAYIFTNISYGTDGFKKSYKFDTAEEAVRKLARQELDDNFITDDEAQAIIAPVIEAERKAKAVREAAREAEFVKWNQAKHLAAKIAVESKSIDSNFRFAIYNFVGKEVQDALVPSRKDDTDVFDMLPTVDELNDCRSDIEKEFDKFAAKYTDRDARFNHGERHAAKFEKKLREIDPTVEVTYDIDEDGEDVFFMTCDGIHGGIYYTLDSAEEAFHLLKKNQADQAATVKKSAKKNYSINPDIESDDANIKINHINIYTDKSGTIRLDGIFQCKKVETAYRRFRKIMIQVDAEHPELNLGDENDWLPAEKIELVPSLNIQGAFVGYNENGDTLFTNDGDNSLALDINEDNFYFFGAFDTCAHTDNATGNGTTDTTDATSKIEITIGADATPAMIDIFEPNKITFNTHAQIFKLIEDTAGSPFSFDFESYFIEDGGGNKRKFITRHFVSECGGYGFIEIITEDGKLDHVEFVKCYGCGCFHEVDFYLAEPVQGNESQDDDTDKYFELVDELDEIGGDICDTKDILEHKIANGAPQTEIKSLEGYIDEREDEYRTLHKRIYDVNPQSDITVDTEQATDTVANTVNREFDKAVKDSIENYGATLDINGETLTFEGGQLSEIASTRYGAYFKIRNGRKIFYYRGNRVSKQDFFEHIATEDKAADERAKVAQFVDSHGGSEIVPAFNPQGKFVAQLHMTLANGRKDSYAASFDSKDAAHAFITEFKALAGDMKFSATIKRGSFYGEVIYRHGLKGQEFFAPVTDKFYPIDIAIYHGGDILTEAQLHDAAAQLSKAITANGNFGEVEIEESYLSVIGFAGGDNKTIWKIVGDLCRRGDCVLESWDAETEELREMPGVEIDALLERMGIDNEPLAFEIPAYDAAVKKIFGDDAPAIFTPGGHLTVEVVAKETPDKLSEKLYDCNEKTRLA